ncbi:cation-translocating P-type ATPase [Ligaoa zhengdingensis]|uniref:cation-translocating P-type ATPase n=2 Tax=Ligaoa zhengdingensis TaxID=2763658 RepID=UPI0031B9FA5E
MARREAKGGGYGGLTTQQASKRLFEFGENVLESGKRHSAMKMFLGQFKDLMVIILLIATVLSVFMGEAVEALTIVLIVLVNAILGFLQEYRTEKTLDALKEMAAPHAKVIRDGKKTELPAIELVPGDLILLEAGDRVPADAQVIEQSALQADEAMLSGESLPVEKKADQNFEHPSREHDTMVFMGTNIVKGRCKAIVLDTGMRTEMGKIAGLLTGIEEEPTPLQQKLDGMSKYLAFGCLAICAIVAVTGILRGEPIFDMILTGISLAVAAIPEGLPAVVTIALALAVKRMLGRNALIRKLHAVETMGCAGVICSDKTGTLTENRMTVKELYTAQRQVNITGNGAEKAGELICKGSSVGVAAQPDIRLLLDIAVMCNNASLEQESEDLFALHKSKAQWKVAGEPTEAALLIMAAKANVTQKSAAVSYTRVEELPFDSSRKCMSVVVQDRGGSRYLLTKGAPDIILEKCSQYQDDREQKPLLSTVRFSVEDANERMAKKALRVLAFAYRELGPGEEPREEGLTFVGLAGMIDPPRKETYEAVRKCRRAGIRTVMITGDHKLTASAIASELGILRHNDQVLTGKEIDRMSDGEFEAAVGKTAVFARVSPEHKLRIVRALKKQGNIVAMTGDGVNDAPAVKEADIGVAMGEGGTDVTKEASSVILLDDNFATLVAAIEEGRVIYRNIRKFIRYLLSCNIGEVITMFAGMLMGMPVILLPIQILLINLATDGLPAIALGLEPADKDVMDVKPRSKNESIFSGGLLSTILFRGCLIGLTTVAVFSNFMREFGDLDLARTGAFATLVITQLIHVFECKSEEHGLFGINPLNNKKLILAVLVSAGVLWAAIYLPFLNGIFRTVPLGWHHLATMAVYIMFAPILSSILILSKRRPKNFITQEETAAEP